MDYFDLKGRVAVVTGGGGILGAGFCRVLAEHGAKVAVLDSDLKNASGVATDLMDIDPNAEIIAVEVDVSDESSVERSIESVMKRFGRIDILHNNAATKTESLSDFFAPLDAYKLETWKKVMSVNVDGMFLMARAVGREMIAHSIRGSIIQTASIYGMVGPDQRIYEGSEYMGVPINTPAVYSASKGAVLSLTKYLATYWGGHGIRVNSLTPGGVSSGQNSLFNERYSARVPLGRMAEAYELESALLFLASDASSYVTGQNIAVDGGWTSW